MSTPSGILAQALLSAGAGSSSPAQVLLGQSMGGGVAPLPQKTCYKNNLFGIGWLTSQGMGSKSLAGTLSQAYLAKVPKLGTITRYHRDYECPTWVLYYRRRVEATKDLNRSIINTSLFNLCFGGWARRKAIWQLCLSEHHTAHKCPCRVLALDNTLAYTAAIQGEAMLPPSQNVRLS